MLAGGVELERALFLLDCEVKFVSALIWKNLDHHLPFYFSVHGIAEQSVVAINFRRYYGVSAKAKCPDFVC